MFLKSLLSFRAFAMMAALVLVAACEPPPQTYTPQQIDVAAQLLEAKIKQDTGKVIDGEFRVRSVSRKGSVVTMNLELLDKRIVALANTDPEIFGQFTTGILAKQICEGRNARDLINAGLRLDIRFVSSRNRPLFTSVINRC